MASRLAKFGVKIFVTKKDIKLSEYAPGRIDVQAMINNINKPQEVTFFSVMNEVFGKPA